MKCPVCKNECYESQNDCPWCGFSEVNRVFVNNDDAEEWLKTVIEPCQKIWKKAMEQWKSQTNQLREELDKYKNQVEALTISKAAMKIIYNAEINEKGKYSEFIAEDQHWICDGFRIIRFNQLYETFDVEQEVEKGSQEAIKKLLNDAKFTITENKQDLPTPSIELLEIILEDDQTFDFGQDAPVVNIYYLIDMLEALPDSTLWCEKGNAMSPVYFCSSYGEGILLPINNSK